MFETQTQEPVVLSADENAVFLREIKEMANGLGYLAEMARSGNPIDANLTHSILYIAESGLVKLSKITGVEIDSLATREVRYAELRRANTRIHELERLLAQGTSAEQARMAIREMLDRLSAWWRADGLGHVSDAHLSVWGGVEVTLSCSLFGNFRLTGSDTPVSDKSRYQTWMDSLTEQGFVILTESRNRANLPDCEQNRKALISLIQNTIPSAEIRSFSNQHVSGGLVLRDVKVSIDNLEDIACLPARNQE